MVSKKEVIEKYSEYSGKYKLPNFEELDFEFEIYNSLINADSIPDYFLRYTRRRMVDAFYSWINYLHNFIFPNQQSAILLNEYSQFNEEEKKKITKIINKIMFIARMSTKLEASKSEKEDAKFIKDYFEEYKKTRKDLIEFAEKNIDSWEKSDLIKEEKRDNSYYG